jgi:hypothetical protein
MTTNTVTHQPVHKDVHTDRHKDGHVDARKADRDDSPGDATPGTAFVIVLANHKRGVTKATSTANLGAMLAEAGRRVLIVDCDPQANLSEAFGWTDELPGERLEDLLAHPEATQRYTPPVALQPDVATELRWRERLRIIPCTDALADVAADLPSTADGYETRLRELLDPLLTSSSSCCWTPLPGSGTCRGWRCWRPTDC